jgi:rRNA maturation endonuclease Nob1
MIKKCLNCKKEFETDADNDGQDVCSVSCGRAYVIRESAKRARARENRKARESAYRDCGMIKVRGALGGTYWE